MGNKQYLSVISFHKILIRTLNNVKMNFQKPLHVHKENKLNKPEGVKVLKLTKCTHELVSCNKTCYKGKIKFYFEYKKNM